MTGRASLTAAPAKRPPLRGPSSSLETRNDPPRQYPTSHRQGIRASREAPRQRTDRPFALPAGSQLGTVQPSDHARVIIIARRAAHGCRHGNRGDRLRGADIECGSDAGPEGGRE
ncbi:hypothetical protein ACUXK4_003412 [Methylorubrum extorquens]